MADLKHVGKMKGSDEKVVVPYRTIPGDSHSAVVISTSKLSAEDHDAMIKVVESNAGQSAFELYEVLTRSVTPDGQNMLVKFHTNGNMQKVSTDSVVMTPNTTTTIGLDELNKIIAEQKGVSIDDLAVKPDSVTTTATAQTARNTEALSDDQLAAQMRSQADRFYKEAARLRKEAETLSPTKKEKSK
tara:strand:+ start:1586 stop:2146 length:561 start_codon:yes stop_codon:yes gene_type:complete